MKAMLNESVISKPDYIAKLQKVKTNGPKIGEAIKAKQDSIA